MAKIHKHEWKERLKISTNAKFESDLLKTNERYNSRSRNFTDACMVGMGEGGGGQVRASHHRNVCKILGLCGAISLLSLDVSPLNLIKLPYFKPFFPAVSMDIRLLLFIKI